MKRSSLVIGWLLLLCLFVQSFSKVLVWIQFQWDREAIARTLCENRTKPQLRCGGKCQLGKRLAAAQKETGGSSHRMHKAYPDGSWLATLSNLLFLGHLFPSLQHNTYYRWPQPSPFISTVFRPPDRPSTYTMISIHFLT